jgi:recombination protein RecA
VSRAGIGEDKANMVSALTLRAQIEAALADRIPSALTPAPRMVRPVIATGVGAVDEVLQGGLPVGALTEMVGEECSGRTALALKFVAQVTRAEKVCAWVDVSDALSPESAAACGVDLARMLWVRCGVLRPGNASQVSQEVGRRKGEFAVPKKYFVAKPVVKGLHGGGMGGHPRGEAKGMDEAVSGLFEPGITARCAEPQRRVREAVEVNCPGLKPPDTAGLIRGAKAPRYSEVQEQPFFQHSVKTATTQSSTRRSWGRIEQALKVTDLLLQAGGFAAIVLDMGSLAAEHVSRIPLATWFRYRAGAERTRACVLLLTQHACSKSSAGLVLRMASGGAVTAGATVLTGFERRVEMARWRFAESEEGSEKVVSIRKPPQRVGVAMWRSGTAWAGRR